MGGWKLEVFKMGVYMFIPVSLFYYFNQPEFFEEWMMTRRNVLFPPRDPTVDEQIRQVLEIIEDRQEEKWREQMKKHAAAKAKKLKEAQEAQAAQQAQ